MLPSTGYFKALSCPYLAEAEAGCSRPHCHFRHGRVYRPTPLAQLRRHLPVPYTPRPAAYRPAPAPAYTPGGARASDLAYTPAGARSSDLAYSPGGARSSDVAYSPGPPPPQRPTHAAYSPAKLSEPVEPASIVKYKPTPLTISTSAKFSSDEEEPAAKKFKNDRENDNFMELEDLASEFEILDQILDEEKCTVPSDGEPTPSTVDKSASNDHPQHPKSTRNEDKTKNDGSKPKKDENKSKNNENKIKSDKGRSSKSLSQSSKKHPEKRKHSTEPSDDKDEKRKSKDSRDRSRDGDSKNSHLSKSNRARNSSSSSKESGKRRDDDHSKSKKSESKSRSASDRTADKSSKSNRSDDKKPRSDRKNENDNPKRHRPDKSKRDKERSSRKSEESSKNDKESAVELNFTIEDGVMDIYSSESDEEAINQECLKIFEEYRPSVKTQSSEEPIDKREAENEESLFASKKRVAHSADTNVQRIAPRVALPNHKAKAVQLMAERYKIRKSETMAVSSPSVDADNVKKEPPMTYTAPTKHSKIRIAHVPNVSTLLSAKKTLPKPADVPKPTIAQTVAKGVARTAHMPGDKFCDRPSVLEPLTSKVSLNIRSRYLNLMIDECLKIYLAPEDAYARALQEELATSKKCSSILIYKNSASLAISRLRKELQEADGIKKGPKDGGGVISHNRILDGKLAEKTSWSIERKYRKDNQFSDEFIGIKFYNNIARWILSEQELIDNGFPRPHPSNSEKGRAKIFTKNTKQKPPRGNVRTCCRCNKEYAVDKKGFAIVKEECFYHPKNKFRIRQEVSYQCCRQDETSEGCLSAACHVYEYLDHDNLRGFVRTLPKEASADANTQVYSLDCEMCYTTNGLDLTRVTVIDSSCKVIYESLVKPIYPIIDYNTRFSGLTEENMKNCKTSLLEVQATFLHMFSDKTILVGHSLESDFKALKLIHDTVVDTSVLFPHKMGPPYKRALRNLSSEHLKKIIQNSVEGGHDSAEDAMVCMELLVWKLKEELKLR